MSEEEKTTATWEPGEIIYAKPGLAIMALEDDRYLIGEKILRFEFLQNEVQTAEDIEEFAHGISMAYQVGIHGASLGILTECNAVGYGLGMHSMSVNGRHRCWACLQRNPDNLFAVHPYIEKIMVADAVERNKQ